MYAQSEPIVLGPDEPVSYSWKRDGTLIFQNGD
jgi:hypothetical protein